MFEIMERARTILFVLGTLLLAAPGCSDSQSADARSTATAASADQSGPGHVSADDLAHLDLRIYPNVNTGDTVVSKKFTGGYHVVSLMTTTFDRFDKVNDWYKAHINQEFHNATMGTPQAGEVSTFVDRDPDDAGAAVTLQRSITLTSARDATGQNIVLISLETKSTSTEAPREP